jgi:hypothetical protein
MHSACKIIFPDKLFFLLLHEIFLQFVADTVQSATWWSKRVKGSCASNSSATKNGISLLLFASDMAMGENRSLPIAWKSALGMNGT